MIKYRLYKILRMFHLISKKKYKKLVSSYLALRTPDYLLLAKSRLFDGRWYLEHNPDVKEAGIDPILHYLHHGWKENRECTPYFDGKKYLEKYPDVAAGNINPLLHWEKYGKAEGRDCLFVSRVILKEKNNDIFDYKKIKEGICDIETIKNIISSKQVKVVSFDIFDTLLLRPVINPTDIFYLIDKKLKELYHIDFLSYRLNVERDLNNPFATINSIYEYIRTKYNLSNDVISIMKREELLCEKKLLTRREDMFQVYQYAVKSGKRIIVSSDMYLPSSFLRDVLRKNGYVNIAHVYVSNECSARKDTGDLYALIKKKERTSQIVHIGDNYTADYLKALEKNITAIYYPSVINIVFSDKSIYNKVWVNGVSPDPICRILLGFTLNNYFKDLSKIKNQAAVFADFRALIQLGLAPVIMYIVNSIANNKDIQTDYSQILFASRDGYLPKLGYDVYAKYQRVKPAKYIYAGRRAYFSLLYKSLIDYIHSLDVYQQETYTVETLLSCYIYDEDLLKYCLSQMTDNERNLDFVKNKPEIIYLLSRFEKIFSDYYQKHQQQGRLYYENVVGSANREVVFDCGYSGSVSTALMEVFSKPVDKIYLWETSKNKVLDEKRQTKTFLLMHEDKMFMSHHLMYEELFSPLEGGCLGFCNGSPVLEKLDVSDVMKQEYSEIKVYVEQYVTSFCKMFRPYLKYMNIYDTYALQQLLVYGLTRSPFNEIALLDNVKFSDRVFMKKTESLSYKIQKYLSWNNPFIATGFENPENRVVRHAVLLNSKMKLAIHIHLYHIYLYSEFLEYLQKFPIKFDLIVTICDEQKIHIVENIFENSLPNLGKLIIKVVPNRGRDVAPWLITTREFQNQYDFFCHVHSKVSTHIDWGNDWRKYIIKNLLDKDAVIEMLNIFTEDSHVGCLFPAIYEPLKDLCTAFNVRQEGMFGEQKMIDYLLKRMGYDYKISRKDLYFSEGTMMWYRPSALSPLFDMDLRIEEFPPEPIGIGGTIAHAIERLPALVCNLNGYVAKEFTYYEG